MTTQPTFWGYPSTRTRQTELFDGTTDTGLTCCECGRRMLETESGYLCCESGCGRLLATVEPSGNWFEDEPGA